MPGMLGNDYERLGLLPHPYGALASEGRGSVMSPGVQWGNWIAPEWLDSARRAFLAPINAWKGQEVDARDSLNVALNVVGSGLIGRGSPLVPASKSSFGIVSPKQAMNLKTVSNLPQDETFAAAVANTKGASVTPEGLMLNVERFQNPSQAMQPSTRGGVMYLPEASPQMTYYKTGKFGYGGTDRITGETLLKRPLFVKGATGGKAGESAYDTLMGRGGYKTMRKDALDTFRGWNVPHAQKVANVQRFLEKYAPELMNKADYIVQYSNKGNQLAYALQEAAVSAAVRRAGYDSVLGYSVSRGSKQPFISEVFDVREMNYPDAFGSMPDIWPMFER